MRKVSAPFLFVVGLLIVGAVAVATYGVVVVFDLDDDGGEPASAAAGGDGGGGGVEAPPDTLVPLGADQVAVRGFVTAATLERAVLESVPTPLQVTVAEAAGAGGALLLDVEVDGLPAEIQWDGGRPFDLHGDGLGIRPHTVNLFAAPAAVTVGFADGEVHTLLPGSYGLQTPVAVGSSGVARPVDSVAFEAHVESTISFRGGATTAMLPRELTVEGPGRVLLEGPILEVRRPDGSTVGTTRVELADGPFELTLTPRPDGTGYDVDAVLQGNVTVT